MSSVTTPCARGAEVFGPRRGQVNFADRLRSIPKSGCFGLLLALVLINFSQPASAQQTLFTTQTPVLTDGCDSSACTSYELGMKFQSSVGGTIRAIRYWKDANEPAGNHVGHIWSSTGTSLASTTFVNETASGWQQQALTSPLTIQANTTYVVSVNIVSHYVDTNSGPFFPILNTDAGLFFPVVNGALTSLADGDNAVFGKPGLFPTQSYEFSNYFRDVVFTPGVANPPGPRGCLQKLVSVDGGNTFAAHPNFGSPAVALPDTAVEFQLVATNCGNVSVTPGTVDACINANPKAAPFACAPAGSHGQGAPGLILYEPPTPAPTSSSLAPGASVTYSKTQLPFLLVSATQFATLCQTAMQDTGESEVRNDAELNGTDANGNPVGYEADAYVQCPAVAPPPTCSTGLQPITYNLSENSNNTSQIVWFNSHFKLQGNLPTSNFTVTVQNGTIHFGTSTLTVPNAVITFSAGATCASTKFDTTLNQWETTLPLSAAGHADEIFAAGLAYVLPPSFPQNVQGVTWTADFTASVPALQMQWQWGAANYLSKDNKGHTFPMTAAGPDYNAMMVDPGHNVITCAGYNNGDHAGTPENTTVQVLLTGGGSGGGGSNWTGGWSSTQSLVCQQTNVTPPGASTLGSGNACNGVYSGTFNGDVNISAGQNCMFINGTITGNVSANGGNLVLSEDLIGGNVQINGGGTFFVAPFTTIHGNLQVQNLPSGTAVNQICGATVSGDLQFQNNGTSVLIGAAPPSSCAGNVVGGNLEVQNNTGSISIFGNTVTGNLQDQNNTGSTQVLSNAVKQHLQCQNNSSITGGMNTAQQKQGQCIGF